MPIKWAILDNWKRFEATKREKFEIIKENDTGLECQTIEKIRQTERRWINANRLVRSLSI
jgi:hypothetical protein